MHYAEVNDKWNSATTPSAISTSHGITRADLRFHTAIIIYGVPANNFFKHLDLDS